MCGKEQAVSEAFACLQGDPDDTLSKVAHQLMYAMSDDSIRDLLAQLIQHVVYDGGVEPNTTLFEVARVRLGQHAACDSVAELNKTSVALAACAEAVFNMLPGPCDRAALGDQLDLVDATAAGCLNKVRIDRFW